MSDNIYKVKAKPFNQSVRVPSSKSYANRVLILASLCTESVEILNLPLSHDVTNLINCLRTVGLEILEVKNGIRIVNSFPECELLGEEVIKIYPGDGGTTTRFLIPFLALGEREYQVEPEGRMRDRPIKDLLNSLSDMGAAVTQPDSWLTISGPISSHDSVLSVDASKTTQHATAMALALCFKNIDIIPIGMDYSASYWKMTKSLLESFKQGIREFTVPVDFSSMSYLLALGADLGSVNIENCTYIDEYQSDSVFVNILKEMGCEINLSDKGLVLSKTKPLIPVHIDCSDCPDLVPTLAFICSRVDGESTLSKLSILKYKESDRLFEIQKLLNLYSIENFYNEKEDFLTIYGTSKRSESSENVFPPDDHRIVMTSYLFMRANGGGNLSSIGSVSKSFANFFEIVKAC